uniref:Uncharacterized protein n=1 Tax=Manihot esculenta TaxID=3983 RepID=A0A2C9UPC2_MANES
MLLEILKALGSGSGGRIHIRSLNICSLDCLHGCVMQNFSCFGLFHSLSSFKL